MVKPITIFVSYAHSDDSFLRELQTFLKPYEREKIINIWTDKDIVAGQKWDDLIKAKLNESEVILFLVSPDFLASDYINDNEIEEVLKKEKSFTVPIIIRPTDLSLLKIKYLQIIPTGAKPVTEWESRDKAWNDVISKLKEVFIQVNQHPALTTDVSEANSVNTPIIWKTKNPVNFIMKLLSLLLVVICISAFVYGLIKHDSFYLFASIAGIAAAFVGYMFVSRS